MISRTILEWQSLRYGPGDDCIPEWAADRIASVARKSPLGGEGGARVLSHGRKEIRAGQVVGVIAAEDCALEILPKIDFAGVSESGAVNKQIRTQLVHMLAVVLDLDIDAGNITDLGWQRENILEILIRLFASKLTDLVRQGMPRRYLESEEDLLSLRGRLNVTRQFTTFAATPQKLACQFDALSPDISLNQIMKAAVRRLASVSASTENQRLLRELAFIYADISPVRVPALRWDDLVLDRTNSRWRELVRLAKLLLGDRFQTTSAGSGRGFSLLFEMNTLFEEYVARMLKRALAGSGLNVHAQGGRRYCLQDMNTQTQQFLTKPDLMLKRNGSTELIIDTKWKRLHRRIDDPKQGVSQADVYQMMAYGRVYQCPRLMLLYPHHDALGRAEGIATRHSINGSDGMLGVATIDVSTSSDILERLRELSRFRLSSPVEPGTEVG
ncbi:MULTISPECIES: McrC family protein [Bradyrhizobium]|uniref:IQ calmodulin-binding- domain protein n=1 Tax=Bradyrhizobium diazoefficiens TaxID=1355477 RepID=A0A810B4F8_9BRAD|nr:restriction endonuclease [Bradyrhizobium diazoefficiens]AWO88393.1 restriction endonuclease [Bradyrhizobium diazoefficiens]WLB37806.1 restriction endonuclease [Bradyrhizobium diazoefficiens]BCE27565.1 IQ calmodulin-binding- domain protein [Bradyrhizobium diazoefficiens]BCE71252.1 IQ calmodulin-binding- domain protein [Bradyrhizobium diazoefficiens]BCE79934.1 IQ calmodulin-binding- domain protein [Bradyrhizobium diazoefficiens]